MVFLIIIPIKWLFHWEYNLFSTHVGVFQEFHGVVFAGIVFSLMFFLCLDCLIDFVKNAFMACE